MNTEHRGGQFAIFICFACSVWLDSHQTELNWFVVFHPYGCATTAVSLWLVCSIRTDAALLQQTIAFRWSYRTFFLFARGIGCMHLNFLFDWAAFSAKTVSLCAAECARTTWLGAMDNCSRYKRTLPPFICWLAVPLLNQPKIEPFHSLYSSMKARRAILFLLRA